MIYDTRGQLAGVQVGIDYKPTNLLDVWHQHQLFEKTYYSLQLYFVNETEICGERKSGPYGNLLMIKLLSGGFRVFPNTEPGPPFENFKKGKCMWAMGMHYWFEFLFLIEIKGCPKCNVYEM
jgi:hypothetical protein